MDTNGRINLINSISKAEVHICPNCGAVNRAENNYCNTCGSKINISQNTNKAPAFGQIKESDMPIKYKEPSAIFAQGLPSWSIEPPQVVVRRR